MAIQGMVAHSDFLLTFVLDNQEQLPVFTNFPPTEVKSRERARGWF